MITGILDDLVVALQSRQPSVGCLTVGVDGAPGAGESTLARAIRDRLDGHIVELDDYLDEGGSTFLPCRRCE